MITMVSGNLPWRRLGMFIIGIALLHAVVGAASAQDEKTAVESPQLAENFIKDLANEALAVWADTALTEQERRENFRDLLKDNFAIDYISQLVLGRHWRTASREQIETYRELFPDYIVNIFARRIGDYGRERVEVNGSVPAGTRDLFVRSTIVRPGSTDIPADWRVRQMDDRFQIIDLKVEGVSMAITQRDEFSSTINQRGMQGLLNDLRSAVKNADQAATSTAQVD